MEKFSRDEVMKVLIVQWQDTSPQVRINVIKCLGKILRNKASKDVSEALKFLHGLICSLPMSFPYKFIYNLQILCILIRTPHHKRVEMTSLIIKSFKDIIFSVRVVRKS